MWLRSEKKERHLLSPTIGQSRSNRSTIKKTTPSSSGQRTGAKINGSWKQVIKRDVARNGLKKLKTLENLPVQTSKTLQSSKVLRVIKRDASKNETVPVQNGKKINPSRVLKDNTYFSRSMQKSTSAVRTRTNVNRECIPQAKAPDKLSPLRPKSLFVNRIESKKTQPSPCRRSTIEEDKIVNNSKNQALHRTLYPSIVNENIIRDNNNGNILRSNINNNSLNSRENRPITCDSRNSKSLTKNNNYTVTTPRKSTRLEKSERSAVMNGSPSRKVRQMPKRPINQTVPNTTRLRLSTKRHNSNDAKPTPPNLDADVPKMENKGAEVPTAEIVANDWVAVVDQDMTMYEKDLDKFVESDCVASGEESDYDIATDQRLGNSQFCLSEERLNNCITIENENFVKIKPPIDQNKEAINKVFGRCNSLDRKITCKERNNDVKCRKLSTLRKNLNENRGAKRRSSAIELNRSYSVTRTDESLRRVSCDRILNVKNYEAVEINITTSDGNTQRLPTFDEMDVQSIENDEDKIEFYKFPPKEKHSEIDQNLNIPDKLDINLTEADLFYQKAKISPNGGCINEDSDNNGNLSNCEDVLRTIEQPDFISMLTEAREEDINDNINDDKIARKRWSNCGIPEEDDVFSSCNKQDNSLINTRTAIERLEALSDLQLQPTSFLADISQSLAAAGDGWVL